MNLQEFETRYRETMDLILNQLQTLNLLASNLQIRVDTASDRTLPSDTVDAISQSMRTQILQLGTSVQELSLTVEEYLRSSAS